MKRFFLAGFLCVMSASGAWAQADEHRLQRYLQSLPEINAPAYDDAIKEALAALPLSCINRPQLLMQAPHTYLWMNKDKPALLDDYERTRAFYGCGDWHSAVNSTWALVTLLKENRQLRLAPVIRDVLDEHLTKENVAGEVAFFNSLQTGEIGEAFERPYGYSWVLKLYAALKTWEPAKSAAENLRPLAELVSKKYVPYLENLKYAERIGLHANTAFNLSLVLDYTAVADDPALDKAARSAVTRFFAKDKACPTAYEPFGAQGDFISPCLTEAALVSRVLPQREYMAWLDAFLPPFYDESFQGYATKVDTTVRGNGEKMTIFERSPGSHLTALAFERAAEMMVIAKALPRDDTRARILERLATLSATQGYDELWTTGFAGSHFLASYAVFYQEAVAGHEGRPVQSAAADKATTAKH